MSLYIGIDLGGSSIKSAAVSDAGEVQFFSEEDTPADTDSRLQTIAETVSRIEDAHSDRAARVAVGSPGMIDDQGGLVGAAFNLPGWENAPISELVSHRIGRPVEVTNDANLAVYAEALVGAGAGADPVFGLVLGTGVGSGLVINAGPFGGAHGFAGELGHVVVEPGGIPCSCGSRGCLEQYAGAVGLENQARLLGAEGDFVPATAREILAAAEEGLEPAAGLYETAVEMIARGLGAVINIVSPAVIVIGGGLFRESPSMLEDVSKRLSAYSLDPPRQRCDVRRAVLGHRAGAIGAALFAQHAT